MASCLCSPSSKICSSPLKGCESNCRPGGKYWQPTAGFVTHVTYRPTAKNRDQLRNPTLGSRLSRVWATFTFLVTIPITCTVLRWGHGTDRDRQHSAMAAVSMGIKNITEAELMQRLHCSSNYRTVMSSNNCTNYR